MTPEALGQNYRVSHRIVIITMLFIMITVIVSNISGGKYVLKVIMIAIITFNCVHQLSDYVVVIKNIF